ncbi:MAG TPA: class I SAM-dependent methyltransferase [Kofleriaceae bacterium]|jgi:hypothetical protein
MTEAFREISACRACDHPVLESVVDLGSQVLTGVFPRHRDEQVTSGPLELVRCTGACGLVQLRHSYSPSEMYGDNYGYRSGLNRSMVDHLGAKVRALLARRPLGNGDVVLDIGSNDGTTLSFYPDTVRRIGIDPTASKFAAYYKPGIEVMPDFFTAARFRGLGAQPAKIVTSIAMFYDLERPLDFARDVASVLADDGIWHFEQSYLPAMLATTSYDTICHEHVEYYSLATMRWMMERVGLWIVDCQRNDVNGGSFAVTVTKNAAAHAPIVATMIEEERSLSTECARFPARVDAHKRELVSLLRRLQAEGKRVVGYGASTKGNVLLQYCGIDASLVSCIAEVNPDKLGCFTPGTRIPIVSEADAIAMQPFAFLVLPWHFRANILSRARPIFDCGIQFLFPLPTIELVASA